MLPGFGLLLASFGFFHGTPQSNPAGYLTATTKGPGGMVQKHVIPYRPREGDLVFYDDHHPLWTVLFIWAGSGPPLHMGIVVKRPDGSPAILEAGPDDKLKVYIFDPAPRLKEFKGTITIRRCKASLKKEPSAAMTQFALAQEGKPYAVIRLLLQGTWFRCRGPIRELFLAHTYFDRWSWICSELAVAAGTKGGLFNPNVVRANVTYPRDIVDNRRFNLGRVWHDAETWSPKR